MEENDRITLRLERENLAKIDAFIAANPQFGSRSHLCRIALQSFLEGREESEGGVRLKVPRVLMEYIDSLVDEGYFLDREHAVLRAVESYFSREKLKEINEHRKEIGKATGKIFPVAGGDGVIPP